MAYINKDSCAISNFCCDLAQSPFPPLVHLKDCCCDTMEGSRNLGPMDGSYESVFFKFLN